MDASAKAVTQLREILRNADPVIARGCATFIHETYRELGFKKKPAPLVGTPYQLEEQAL